MRYFPVLLLALFFMIPQERRASKGNASRAIRDVASIDSWIQSYRDENDRLPDEKEVRAALAGKLDGAPYLPKLDPWKYVFVYRVLGKHGEYDLYSTGANCGDDGGEGDDITSLTGVKDGYYWKKHWPLGRWMMRIATLMVLLMLLLRFTQPRLWAGPVFGALGGFGIIFASRLLLPEEAVIYNVSTNMLGPLGLLVAIYSMNRFLTLRADSRKGSSPPPDSLHLT